MTEREHLRSDEPVVGPGRCCANCRSWSRWLGTTGDCLLHAYRRRQQILDGTPAAQLPEMKAARTTDASEACDGFEPTERTAR